MKPILKATAILGSGSLVSIFVGLLSAKVWAVLLGPAGLGLMMLLQSVVGLAGMVAGVGIASALVGEVANALARDDTERVAALGTSARIMLAALSGLAVLVLLVFRAPISRLILGGTEHAGAVALMGVAVVLNLTSGVQTSTLNAYRRVSSLAKVAVMTKVLGTVASLLCIWLWSERGIAPAMVGIAAAGLAVSRYYLVRDVGRGALRTAHGLVDAARALLQFGVPYTGSMLAGTGVQILTPVLVLHVLGVESVGFYQAAHAVSVTYLGLLATSFSQDYYPRLAAAREDRAALARLVNEQHRVMMLLAFPVILATLALVPYLLPLVYSADFVPAAELLEWQLVGDVLKFSSWTMAFAVLARTAGGIYFGTELAGGLVLFAASWAGMHWFGLAGLGIGFLAAQAVYHVIVRVVVRRSIGMVWTQENRFGLLVALGVALLVRVMPLVGLEVIKTPAAVSLALVASAVSAYTILRQMRRLDATEAAP